MVAAFFAATPLCRPPESKTLRVWALDTRYLTHQGPDEKNFGTFQVLVHRPLRSTDHFLHSQGGVLTELTNQVGFANHFVDHRCWPALEDVIAPVEADKPILVSYSLDTEHADRLLTLLDREGINQAFLMPTLDNVAKTVKDRWERETSLRPVTLDSSYRNV
jgi:hypothetical protein